jgi:hypothetical protein
MAMTMDDIVVTTGNVQELKPRFRGCVVCYVRLDGDSLGPSSFVEVVKGPFLMGPVRSGLRYIVIVTRSPFVGSLSTHRDYTSGEVDIPGVIDAIQQCETCFMIEYNAPSYTAAEIKIGDDYRDTLDRASAAEIKIAYDDLVSCIRFQ